MASFKANRVLPIFLIVIVAIIAIAAIVSIARAVFFPSSSKTATTDTSQQALLSSDATRSVQVTVRGPLVADENFTTYEISVSPNSRSLTTFVGYNKTVTKTVNLNNSTAAYEQFVYALNHANLVKGTPLKGDANDTRGTCATGDVYTFDILEGSQAVKELWTSTCSGSKGSLDASLEQVMNLFTAQIPDAQTTIRTTNL